MKRGLLRIWIVLNVPSAIYFFYLLQTSKQQIIYWRSAALTWDKLSEKQFDHGHKMLSLALSSLGDAEESEILAARMLLLAPLISAILLLALYWVIIGFKKIPK